LCADIFLNIPVISAAMDTVTEWELAIALALQGGAGVIHRNLSPADQAEQVARVKRYLNWIIENPITISKDQSISEARQIMEHSGISGLPVLHKNRLCGILTNRDLRFCRDFSQTVEQVMTPSPIVEHESVTKESAQEKFDLHKIEKLPVVDRKGHLIGLITVKDMEKNHQYPKAALDQTGRLIVGAAISPMDFDQRLPLLIDNKVDFVVIDVAHGNTESVVQASKTIKQKYRIPLIGGNVISAEGTRNLINVGVDAVKVGVGPGASCTTRVIAGIGVPQFSAVLNSAEVALKHNIPIVADGGIKYSGDITKAIAAGASTVMIGNLFAGLKEAPGREIIYEGRIFKEYRGMGSMGAIKEGSGDRYQMSTDEDPVPEGIEGRVPYKGELKGFLHQLVTGLRKGMAYTGCRTIAELQSYRKFVRITSAGLRESHPHDMMISQEAPNYSVNR
jgi:IMP dehydrogenase